MRVVLYITENDTQRHRKEGDLKIETGIGVTLRQANQCQKPPKARRTKEFSPEVFGGTLVLGLLVSKI